MLPWQYPRAGMLNLSAELSTVDHLGSPSARNHTLLFYFTVFDIIMAHVNILTGACKPMDFPLLSGFGVH